jgi:hypothetical protein
VKEKDGTNSLAPGLKENSLAFGLSGMDQNAPEERQTAKHTRKFVVFSFQNYLE